MTATLPLEVLEMIGRYFGEGITTFKLILGMIINKDQVFCEGGFGVILQNILMNYPDKRTLLNIKKYFPNKEVPLVKAVLTKNMSTLSMVSDIWGSTYSDYAYITAVETGFVDALGFLGRDVAQPSPRLLNTFIIESKSVEAYSKIDFTIDDPFCFTVADKEYLTSFSRGTTEKINKKVYKHEGKIERSLKESRIMEIVRFYHEQDRIEETILYLRKLFAQMHRYTYLKVVAGMRDMRLWRGMKDIFGLRDNDLEIHNAYIEEDIERLKVLLISNSYVEQIGNLCYPDVLEKCQLIPVLTRLDSVNEDDLSKDINDWIRHEPSDNQIKKVRKFVELHKNKESINDIITRVDLYGREDIIWFCNICMDLGYKAVEKDHLDMAYMENKTIYYPTLNLRVESEPNDRQYPTTTAHDKFLCLLDLSLRYLDYANKRDSF